jgi:hydrogenase expression/formation protein HypC
MCLAVPGMIEELEGDMAKVRIEGIVIDANVALIEAPQPGDYVLVHAGYARIPSAKTNDRAQPT